MVSATRLERWAYWRTGGLIDRPQRHGAGRGTRSTFPDLARVREQATAVADALRPRTRLDTVALLLHGQGHPVHDEDVKAALLAELHAAQQRFLRNARADSTEDPHTQAWNAGWAAYRLFARGKRAQRRRRAQAELPSPQIWTVAGQILLGQEIARVNLQSLLDGLPLPAALRQQDAVSQIEALAKYASLQSLIRTAASLPEEAVAQANKQAAAAASIIAPRLEPAGHEPFPIQLGITIGLLLGSAHGAHLQTVELPELRELLTTELVI